MELSKQLGLCRFVFYYGINIQSECRNKTDAQKNNFFFDLSGSDGDVFHMLNFLPLRRKGAEIFFLWYSSFSRCSETSCMSLFFVLVVSCDFLFHFIFIRPNNNSIGFHGLQIVNQCNLVIYFAAIAPKTNTV